MSFQNVGTYNAGVFTPKAAGPLPWASIARHGRRQRRLKSFLK